MTSTKFLAGAAIVLATATTASAQSAQGSGTYVNIGAEALDFFGASGNVVGRVGYELNDNFAVEGEGRVGLIEDNDDFKIDYGLAAYIVGKLPVSTQFDVLGRAGYHYTDAGAGDADGFAIGVGGQYNFGLNADSGIRADYTNLDLGDGAGSADVYSVTYARKF